MSAGVRAGANAARVFTRNIARGGGGWGPHTNIAPTRGANPRAGGGGAGAAAPAQARRAFRVLPRAAIRARGASRSILRQPRAACPAMLDLFLHAWDDLDDR
jgi:hypothetical protein